MFRTRDNTYHGKGRKRPTTLVREKSVNK